MIAGGGGYDGLAALKNRTSEVYGFNKKKKKRGMYRSFNWSTACRLQGSAVKAALMVCRQVKLRVQVASVLWDNCEM